MKVNIYYGGRGLLDDPTLYVLNKMEEVLRELRVTVDRINMEEFLILENKNIHLDDQYFITGVKTDAGKSRIIPIHNDILPIIQKYYKMCIRDSSFYCTTILFHKLFHGNLPPFIVTRFSCR